MGRSEIGEWMPFEIDRFFSSPRVQQMKDFQKWWYTSLLLRAWQAQPPCHLPDNENELMILAGATSERSWKEHSALVLGAFRVTGDGYRVNDRQLEIYEEKMGVRETNRINGGKGGRPKKTDLKPNGNRTVSDSSSSDSRSEVVVGFELPKPDYKPVFLLEDFDPQIRFRDLCDAYPKPNRSYLGLQAYQRAIEGYVCEKHPDRNKIADAIEQAAAAYMVAKRGTEKKFIPELIAWLDKGIWSQDPAVWEDSRNGDGQRKQSAGDRFSAALRGANATHGEQLEKP